jgi:indole-3-glycerol phosphate synthase
MQIRRRRPNPAIDISIYHYQVVLPDADPRHILEEIVWQKEVEVDQMRERVPLAELLSRVKTHQPPVTSKKPCVLGRLVPP